MRSATERPTNYQKFTVLQFNYKLLQQMSFEQEMAITFYVKIKFQKIRPDFLLPNLL